jgi:1-acyl-sn-glycerol-3-phosphate acyltransferase
MLTSAELQTHWSRSHICARWLQSKWFALVQASGFWRVEVCGLENFKPFEPELSSNASGGNKPVLLVAPHSTHNFEVLLMQDLISKSCGRIVRGIGHRMVHWMMPHYKLLGIEIASPENAKWLLSRGEVVCVMPGGAEEMLGLYTTTSPNYSWRSLSNKPRVGFARLALSTQTPIQCVRLHGVENMVFAPLATLCRMIGVYTLLKTVVDMRTRARGCVRVHAAELRMMVVSQYILMYGLMFVVVVCQSLLVLPRPCKLRLVIHPHISTSSQQHLAPNTPTVSELALRVFAQLYH